MNRSDLSFSLNLLRVLAAQGVCYVHACMVYGRSFPNIGDSGVMALFLISGFVIAYTLVRKQSEGLSGYIIDRLSRVYTVLIPAMVIIYWIDLVLIQYHFYPSSYTLDPTIFQKLLLLPGTKFDGAYGPMWTLVVEFNLYMIAGIAFFLWRHSKALSALFATSMVYLTWDERDITLLWVIGFASFFFLKRLSSAPTALLAFTSIVSTTCFFYVSKGYDHYLLLSLSFVTFIAAIDKVGFFAGSFVERIVQRLADYCYSFYLLHIAFIFSLAKLAYMNGFPVSIGFCFWGSIIVANIVSMGFAHLTERHYRDIALRIKNFRHPVEKFA